MNQDNFFNELSKLVEDAIDGAFGKPKPKRKPKMSKPEQKIEIKATPNALEFILPHPDIQVAVSPEAIDEVLASPFSSIEDYTARTGKRFRMTKAERESFNLTTGQQPTEEQRNEAFYQRFINEDE